MLNLNLENGIISVAVDDGQSHVPFVDLLKIDDGRTSWPHQLSVVEDILSEYDI